MELDNSDGSDNVESFQSDHIRSDIGASFKSDSSTSDQMNSFKSNASTVLGHSNSDCHAIARPPPRRLNSASKSSALSKEAIYI